MIWGGKLPLIFSETSKSSAGDFSQSWHLWPVFALWIGWWRKVPPLGEWREWRWANLRFDVSRRTIQRQKWWMEWNIPLFFFCSFNSTTFWKRVFCYLVFFVCVLWQQVVERLWFCIATEHHFPCLAWTWLQVDERWVTRWKMEWTSALGRFDVSMPNQPPHLRQTTLSTTFFPCKFNPPPPAQELK